MIRLRRLYARDFKLLRDVDLRFPPRGRFLVRGLNESGKSTLFEAVFFGLFGQALAAETGRGRLDDLIRYGADDAEVGLEIELPGRRLLVDRSIRRGRQNAWRLVIAPDAGPAPEPPVGNQAVNARIEQELGLDAEALLATCFVEQKKLDRLEGMTRAQREASLMRLLNLDRLVHIEEKFRVRAPDRERGRELDGRRRLAALAADLPAMEARVELWAARAAVHTAAGAAERAAHAIEAAEDAARARAAAVGEESALSGLTTRAVCLDEAAEGFRACQTDLDTARALEAEARSAGERSALRLRLARCAEILDEARSEAAGQQSALADLDRRIEETAQGLARLSATRSQRIEARAAAADAREQARRADEDLRALDVREALEEWVRASEAVRSAQPASTGADRPRTAAELILRRAAIGAAAAASAVIALRMAALGQFAGLSLALAALVVCVWLLARNWGAAGSTRADTSVADRSEASVQIARQRLAALNSVVPATMDRARAAVAELDGRLGERTREVVADERTAAVRSEATGNERVAQLAATEAELLAAYGSVDGSALGRERDAVYNVLGRRQRQVAKLEARLAASGGDEAARASYRDFAAAEADQAARTSAARRARADAYVAWRRASEAWSAAFVHVEPLSGELPAEGSAGSTSPGDPDNLDISAWQALHGEVVRELAAAGGATIAARHQEAVRAAARADTEERASLVRRDEALADLHSALREAAPRAPQLLGLDQYPTEQLMDVRAALASLLPALPAESDADARVALASAREELALLRHDLAALEGQLGISAAEVDATAAAEAEAYMRELEVRERAAELVEVAAANVVRAILPSTLAYLRRLLPLLTGGRYFDARLTDDYQIEVWDDTAQSWRKKNIFSGGAKDQFSLALRLSFALATLPEERGAWPGFLFLDEPLGSFDQERASALIDVLTVGEVAESFEQLFLVSHVAVPDRLFDYVITMSDGRVAESDLPE